MWKLPNRSFVLVLAVILIATNLRAPLTSVSPLLEAMSQKLGMSHPMGGLLTTLPLMAFAAFSVLSPRLSNRFGLERVLLLALFVLSAGLLLRPWLGVSQMLVGTLLAGIGIAICNVLLPVLINRYFPQRLGLMTGTYTVSMNLIGSIASALSIPLAKSMGLGWETTLALWGGLALISACYWLLCQGLRVKAPQVVKQEEPRPRIVLWRYKLAWQMTLYLGLQSFLFFIVMAWLPDIAAERGANAGNPGIMVGLMQFCGLPFNFVVPLIAAKVKDQRWLAMMAALMSLAGVGCLFMNHIVILALGGALIGSAAASAFSLSMMFFNMRTNSSRQASEISGMAQSIGYTLACTGPTLFGWLHDLSGGWNIPLCVLLGAVAVFTWAGLGAGRNRKLPEASSAEVTLRGTTKKSLTSEVGGAAPDGL
ncbi:CynX/NimT family MFS transporter [Paenibacillus ferrarius]|uniref:CynX/NimT family MFS transporter n=1 Tax=Paenibacillus ferrarius TaxID=1469647 RepID=UPI003D2B71B8